VNDQAAPKKASLGHRLYHGETTIDFIGRRRIWFAISSVAILAGVVSLLLQGLNFGIDFEGGTSWEVEAPGVSVEEARDAVRPFGLADATIQTLGSDRIRVASETRAPDDQARVTQALADLARADVGQVSVNDVGPSWGDAVTKKARNALVVFFVLISIYISLRFEWKMAVAALAAVVHDILITVGVYSIFQFEVTPATVVAFLTILGYSMYDTIVVFDKVEENAKGLAANGRFTYSDTVNLSMNQVLMRSLNTTISSLLPIVSLLVIGGAILGATTLNDFGLALFVGLAASAYSSICTAAPILAILKEREPRYAAVRQRLTAKGGHGLLTPAAAAALASGGGGGGPAAPPRPRQGAGKKPARRTVLESDDDLLVPSRTTGTTDEADKPAGPARPKPVPRPGAPRPRKKGKRR
jgi:preprotein translocase subunit SecF